jgi:DNA-binding CsgD family transcriptional regulator
MAQLRPIERRILRMRRDGVDIEEIAVRFRRSPQHVERIISWTEIPRSQSTSSRSFRPIERRVLALVADGESHARIAERFRKSPGFIRRVEGIAHYKMAKQLLA